MNKREMNLTILNMTGWDWRNEREMGTLQAQIL